MNRKGIRKAILRLDPTWYGHWMQSGPDKGKPKLQTVRNMYFYAGNDNPREVTRADIDAAIPGYTRKIAYETWLRGGVIPNADFTARPIGKRARAIVDAVLGIKAGVDMYWVKTGEHADKPCCWAAYCGRDVTRLDIDSAMPGYTRKQAFALAAANGMTTN